MLIQHPYVVIRIAKLSKRGKASKEGNPVGKISSNDYFIDLGLIV